MFALCSSLVKSISCPTTIGPPRPHFPARHPHFSTAAQTTQQTHPQCLTPTLNRLGKRACSSCNSRAVDEAARPAAKARSRTSGGRQPRCTIPCALLTRAQTTRMYVRTTIFLLPSRLDATSSRSASSTTMNKQLMHPSRPAPTHPLPDTDPRRRRPPRPYSPRQRVPRNRHREPPHHVGENRADQAEGLRRPAEGYPWCSCGAK